MTSGEAEDQIVDEIKQAHSALFRLSLESFLTSGQFVHLPNYAAPDVSIIIVLFNRSELTLACLRSIHETCHGRVEVILVDNGSSDETSRLLSQVTGAKIVRNPENRHFLFAANQAAKLARGRHILLLNNDAQLLPGTLDAALETMRSAPDIGAVGARIVKMDGTLQEAGSIIWRDGSCLGYGRGEQSQLLAVYVPARRRLLFRRISAHTARGLGKTRRLRRSVRARVLRRNRLLHAFVGKRTADRL